MIWHEMKRLVIARQKAEWTDFEFNEVPITKHTDKPTKLECGPMPNVMVALPNIDGAFCSTPQSLADAHY